MPLVTLIVPAFNVAETLPHTLDSLLAQRFTDFEILIVDDGSCDATAEIAQTYLSHPKLRLIQQRNRGLAGARNTGIAQAKGDLIGFCDADDLWAPTKLESHVHHLQNAPEVGVSYSGSALIDNNGHTLATSQKPRLRRVNASHIFKRNPIGNGSAAVIRRAVFDAIAYRPSYETKRDWYFDETFRQSEDIECWLRIALTTDWAFEGVRGLLTQYRVNSGGLSANTERQLAAWENMRAKLTQIAPDFFAKHTPAARAYQLRYLARRAISDLDGARAHALIHAAFNASKRPLFEEPKKTLVTYGAAVVLNVLGQDTLYPLQVARGARS